MMKSLSFLLKAALQGSSSMHNQYIKEIQTCCTPLYYGGRNKMPLSVISQHFQSKLHDPNHHQITTSWSTTPYINEMRKVMSPMQGLASLILHFTINQFSSPYKTMMPLSSQCLKTLWLPNPKEASETN